MRSRIITKFLIFLSETLRLIKLVLSIVAAVIIFSTISFLAIYFYFARDLPDIMSIEDYRPPVISEVFANDGSKIGEFWLECRIYVAVDEIPKRVAQAFVDSEDSRFFEHKGVDMRSIVRAFVENLRAGSVKQGGSTITQQITRSLLLTRERTITRKVKEAILATRLERYLSKEQILTLYLNQIYLGNRAYGVAAAARNYFHKPLAELTLGEIALIAGLPTAPTNYSPINNATEARNRQMHVLRRMVEEGHISEDEARRTAEEKFTVFVAGTDRAFNDPDAEWFTEHVRRLVKDKYGDEVIYHKGLKIYTTLDMSMQRIANTAVRRGIESLDRRKGWRGAIEHLPVNKIAERAREFAKEMESGSQQTIQWPPEKYGAQNTTAAPLSPEKMYKAIITGFAGNAAQVQVGNIAGSIPIDGMKWAHAYSEDWMGLENGSYITKPEQLLGIGDVVYVKLRSDGLFDLAQDPKIQSALMANDPHTGYIKAMVGGYDFEKSEFNRATQALRQPGSSFKPFVYSAALDKGYTFNTVLMDEPVVFTVGRNETWSPKNYGGNYNGATTFQNAIKFSRNIPTAKIVYDIGTHYLTAYERKMGMTSPIGKYLSMALGANSVYLYEMVQAYSVFDNDGKFIPAVAILEIMDSKGNVIESISAHANDKQPAIADSDDGKEEKSEEETKAPADGKIVIGKTVTENDVNTELFVKGLEAIEKDKLNLTDLEIKTLYGSSIPPGHVMTPQTAFLMVNLLKGVVEGGTGTRVKVLGKPAAGKTGTTNDETDCWFIGFVPDLIAGVWVGYDEIRPVAHRATGGTIAAPIFIDFMKNAIGNWEPKDFTPPEGFPVEKMATITGGSALMPSHTSVAGPSQRGGSGRAGEFFEEDAAEGL